MNSLNTEFMKQSNNLKSLSNDELLTLLGSDLSQSNFTIKNIADELSSRLDQEENQRIECLIEKTTFDLCGQDTIFFHSEPFLSASMIATIAYFCSKSITNYFPAQIGFGLVCGLGWNYCSIQSWRRDKHKACIDFMMNFNTILQEQEMKKEFLNMIPKF